MLSAPSDDVMLSENLLSNNMSSDTMLLPDKSMLFADNMLYFFQERLFLLKYSMLLEAYP
jgi:hypothetical protein